MDATGHISTEDMERYQRGRLDDWEWCQINLHLEWCQDCVDRMDAIEHFMKLVMGRTTGSG